MPRYRGVPNKPRAERLEERAAKMREEHALSKTCRYCNMAGTNHVTGPIKRFGRGIYSHDSCWNHRQDKQTRAARIERVRRQAAKKSRATGSNIDNLVQKSPPKKLQPLPKAQEPFTGELPKPTKAQLEAARRKRVPVREEWLENRHREMAKAIQSYRRSLRDEPGAISGAALEVQGGAIRSETFNRGNV